MDRTSPEPNLPRRWGVSRPRRLCLLFAFLAVLILGLRLASWFSTCECREARRWEAIITDLEVEATRSRREARGSARPFDAATWNLRAEWYAMRAANARRTLAQVEEDGSRWKRFWDRRMD